MGQTLLQKVWDAHAVRRLPTGQTQLFIGLHLVHEVTTPQAFDMLRLRGWHVAFPNRTFATVDHIVPTRGRQRPFLDTMAEAMMSSLERNCREHGIPLYDIGNAHQGIVHVIGPELGLTQPGMTIACGDSHTSTHGAFGAVAFGIGTSQVRDVLASQCLALEPLKVRRIEVTGALAAWRLRQGRHPRDHPPSRCEGRCRLRLRICRARRRAHVDGRAHDHLQHVDRRRRAGRLCQSRRDDVRVPRRAAVCAGRRRVRTRPRLVAQLAPTPMRVYDDRVTSTAARIEPTVTWGINPGQSVGVNGVLPDPRDVAEGERAGIEEALRSWGSRPAQRDRRHAHRRRVHRFVHERPPVGSARSRPRRARPSGRAARAGLVVPGSEAVRAGGGARRAARRVQRGGVRVARRGLLDVPGHEPGPSRRPGGLRLLRRTGISRAVRAARPDARC